jgi:hypothetical protein
MCSQTMSQGKVRFNQIPDRVVQDKRVPDTPNEVCNILMPIGAA